METFVINWDGDLYGDVIRVRFLHRLRDEQKFDSLALLRDQISRDVGRAESYFEHAGVRNMLSIL